MTQSSECLICGSASEPYFAKTYDSALTLKFTREPLEVEYLRCPSCGFVHSATHRDMSDAEWAALNEGWHHHAENNPAERNFNQPPYPEQALSIAALVDEGVISGSSMLDFASGYGTMAKLLRRFFGLGMQLFDPYISDAAASDLTYLDEGDLGQYSLVVNSAMFEHVRSRADLDQVAALVADDGVLMIHTVVCERIPPDPDWFYLDPIVHCAFHTNRSMALLMQQWGFAASIYSPPAKSWWLLRDGSEEVRRCVENLNLAFAREWFIYKDGFVDYWKGF